MISSQNNNQSDGATVKLESEIETPENSRLRLSGRSNAVNDVQRMRDLSYPNGLLIHTHVGNIRIWFRPDLSGSESIKYIADVVAKASSSSRQKSDMGSMEAESINERNLEDDATVCERCKFYRAEPQLLLQGVIAQSSIPSNKILGPCPDPNYKPKLECPAHDPNCGCHGPIMTKGMVGWAGGGGGPDFFINTSEKPVDWWERQHTVWGEIRDEESLRVVESVYVLPAHMVGMRMLNEEIQFSVKLF